MRLHALTLLALLATTSAAQTTNPVMAIAEPGPDRPPIGRSTFDAIFAVEGQSEPGYDIPFPFGELVRLLDQYSGNPGGEDTHLLQMVLIPLGRCVQRHAAAPDYFESPRFVLATNSEMTSVDEYRPVFVRDRLFIGYQPRAEALEVISYNAQAGRFEFQIVDNYATGRTPRVRYASRTECLSCHHNAGPIFPRVRWGETSANTRVANRLREQMPANLWRQFGQRTDQAYYVDGSTDRANMLSTYQTLWQELCRPADDPKSGMRCRAGAFEFAIQQRLRAVKGTFTRSSLINDYLIPISLASFRTRWPQGLAVPSGDVPNRYPLHEKQVDGHDAALDLYQPRRPKMQWQLHDMPRFIDGLASSIPELDLRQLDHRLLELGRLNPDLARTLEGVCDIVRVDDETGSFDATIECELSDGLQGKSFELTGDLYIDNHYRVAPGNRIMLTTPRALIALRNLSGEVHVKDNNWELTLQMRSPRDGSHVWLADEGAVDRIEINWRLPDEYDGHFPANTPLSTDIVIHVIDGYAYLSEGLNQALAGNEAGINDVFSDKPFRGSDIVGQVLRALGTTPIDWCCSDWQTMPPIEVAPANVAD